MAAARAMHTAAVRLRSATAAVCRRGTQYVRRIAQNCACARLCSTSSSQIKAPHVDKYLLRDGNVIGQLEALLCDVGSRVHEDEETAVIETDKVAISVRAPESASPPRCSRASATGWPSATPCTPLRPKRRPSASGRPPRRARRRRRGGEDAHDAQVMAEIERQARAPRGARLERWAWRRAPRLGGCAATARSLRSRVPAGAGGIVDDARSRRPAAEATIAVAARTPCSARLARRAEIKAFGARRCGTTGSRPERRAAQFLTRGERWTCSWAVRRGRQNIYTSHTRLQNALVLALLDRLAGEQVQKIVARLADLLELSLHLAARVRLARRL